LLNINYNYRFNKFSVISNFHFIPFKNKLITLLLFANGGATYINTTEKHKIFSYFFCNYVKKLKILKRKNILFMLAQIKKLSFVSLIELYPGKNAQYSRGSGTYSKIIKIDDKTHTALLQLPSGIKKIFSYYSLAFLGHVALTVSKKFTTNKAGY
jgi:ribosomal protein L2